MWGRRFEGVVSLGRAVSSKRIQPRTPAARVMTHQQLHEFHGNHQPLLMPSAKVRLGKMTTSKPSIRMMSSGDLPAHELVALPALSPTMELGTIVSWEKKVGDQLAEGDLLCEIETDKSTMGFETPEEGYLAKILIPAGTKDIPIGKPLCIIVTEKEDIAQFESYVVPEDTKVESAAPPKSAVEAQPPPTPPPPAVAQKTPVASHVPTPSGPRAFASPAAKRVAAEKGIDITLITQGSGMDGMITSKDVEAYKGPATARSAATAGQCVSTPAGKMLGGMPAPMGAEFTDAELTGMRRSIAKRLQASKAEIPHYYLTVECDVDELMRLRAGLNAEYADEGVKLSVNDFVVKATALASRRVPECNSAWMDSFIREHHVCDVAVAVDTGNGLITPIVASADSLGLAQISADIREKAGRAREGKLQPHEFMGGTITVSNLGMLGIAHFTAIINPPHSCILAVGGAQKKVRPDGEGKYKTVTTVCVTLSCDHRVVDGAVGAQWLKHFKRYIEQPTSMLL